MHLSMKYKSSPFFLLFQLKSIYFWVSRKNLKETAVFIVQQQCSEIEIDCQKCISNIIQYRVCFVFVEKKNITKFEVFSNCNEMILSDLNANTALRNGNFTTSIRQIENYKCTWNKIDVFDKIWVGILYICHEIILCCFQPEVRLTMQIRENVTTVDPKYTEMIGQTTYIFVQLFLQLNQHQYNFQFSDVCFILTLITDHRHLFNS